MQNYTCFDCGFTDTNYFSICPSCNRNYLQPIVSVTNGLLVKHISDEKGRGVYATRKFKYGEMVESCPVLIVPKEQASHLTENVLWKYLFPWNNYGTTREDRAVAMGYGMLYNHHHEPNTMYKFNDNPQLPSIDFYAQKEINAGDEITIYYADRLWFPYRRE